MLLFVHLAVLVGVPLLVASDHKRGVRLLMREEFGEAIPCFMASFDYFERNRW